MHLTLFHLKYHTSQNNTVISDISHITINKLLCVYMIYMSSQNIYINCSKCRMRYDSKKVVVMVVNYTWEPDHLSYIQFNICCEKIF